jgi:hypothetical protein
MRQFLALFDPTFIGGTGSPATWPRCASSTASRPPRHDTVDGYVIAHSSFVYLIDRRGLLRALMPFGHGVDDFVHDVKLLCSEKLMRAAAIGARSCSLAHWACWRSRPSTRRAHDQLFEIPKGTWARRMAGNKVEILPAEMRLTLGVRDILVLHNLDDVPQQFGPDPADAGAEFPAAVRDARELPVRLHRAPERTDEHRRRTEPGHALGAHPLARRDAGAIGTLA